MGEGRLVGFLLIHRMTDARLIPDLHTAFTKFVDDSIFADEIAVGDAAVADLLVEGTLID